MNNILSKEYLLSLNFRRVAYKKGELFLRYTFHNVRNGHTISQSKVSPLAQGPIGISIVNRYYPKVDILENVRSVWFPCTSKPANSCMF